MLIDLPGCLVEPFGRRPVVAIGRESLAEFLEGIWYWGRRRLPTTRATLRRKYRRGSKSMRNKLKYIVKRSGSTLKTHVSFGVKSSLEYERIAGLNDESEHNHASLQ
jgi:hypothetical protein